MSMRFCLHDGLFIWNCYLKKNFLFCFSVSVGAKYSDLTFLFYSLSRTEICTLRQSKSKETCHRFYKRLLGSCQACTVSFVLKHGELWEHIWAEAECTAQTPSPGTAWSFYIYPKKNNNIFNRDCNSSNLVELFKAPWNWNVHRSQVFLVCDCDIFGKETCHYSVLTMIPLCLALLVAFTTEVHSAHVFITWIWVWTETLQTRTAIPNCANTMPKLSEPFLNLPCLVPQMTGHLASRAEVAFT